MSALDHFFKQLEIRLTHMFTRIKRVLIGNPLTLQEAVHEHIPKWKALSVLSSDALSSVAYATEEMLLPLAAFSVMAVSWSMPVALAVGVLLIILTISYRQTIEAYPSGGGAYTVAKENLGEMPGLIAGSSLLIDYVLTVAVSVAAGVAAIASAFPVMNEYKLLMAIVSIFILSVLNLRGVRESGTIFAIPTYLFIISIFALIIMGTYRVLMGQTQAVAPIIHEVYPEIPLFLLLRAFSSGCAALTGIEAISNAVPIFKSPATKNAKITMVTMATLLGVLFLGITLLAHVYGVVPQAGQTAVSLLARGVFGDGWMYYALQWSTMLILLLAANTSYTGFPLLASLLAKDRYLPRQLASLGDKLVFSNGIVGLSFAAIFLVWLYDCDTHRLVPLYAIGVFLSFTLSQAGMVVKHWREREDGWIRALSYNAVGAATTFIVLIVIAITKFTHGAWMVILLIPAFVFVFLRIYNHYIEVGKELSLLGKPSPGKLEKMKHTVIIPISGIHRGVVEALRYSISISDDVRAVYVELDPQTTDNVKREWNKWAHEVPFVVLKSPYRSVIQPLLDYISDLEQVTHDEMITVIIPEFVTAKWWHSVLHNQTALLIRTALLFKRGKVVTAVRYHLKNT